MDIPKYQARVRKLIVDTFGPNAYYDPAERAARLVEEAIELAQAQGLPEDQIQRILTRVYARPKGESTQEAGGLGVCILAWCGAAGVDWEKAVETEVQRIESIPPEHFRKKHNDKVAAGTSSVAAIRAPNKR